jgi:23S rRNA (cytidine1920-2'-O)/16S rRNA (cytidine1409-2'-O)-methyltransferase
MSVLKSLKGKERLDILMLEKGLVKSRQEAQSFILAGFVKVNGEIITRAGQRLSSESAIKISRDYCPYVSRGGLKLQAALDIFQVEVYNKISLDVGASTGGFTDCLLKRGAQKVYAVDVGYGQLAWELRNDPRVIPLEKTNIRYLKPENLPEKVELATIDVSFISLVLVLPAVKNLLHSPGQILALIKPQFEVGKGEVGKGGVVKDLNKHQEVIQKISSRAEELGLSSLGVIRSPLKGPKGNLEYFIYLSQ